MWLIKYNFSTSVLILGVIAFSSLGNCSPVFDDAGVSSQKSYKDDFIVDSIIPNDFSSGEARIFGNFSFGNSVFLTVRKINRDLLAMLCTRNWLLFTEMFPS